MRLALDEIAGADQHAGGTETALQSMLVLECIFQNAHQRILIEAFERADIPAIHGNRERDAGARRLAVDENRAGTANTLLAATMRRGQPQFLAQRIRQAGTWYDRTLPRLAVEGSCN